MKWSVSLQASGDRVMTREEIVELADAVAAASGVASGIGTAAYGVQLMVESPDRETALAQANQVFTDAVRRAGLPDDWPIEIIDVVNEADDELRYLS